MKSISVSKDSLCYLNKSDHKYYDEHYMNEFQA